MFSKQKPIQKVSSDTIQVNNPKTIASYPGHLYISDASKELEALVLTPQTSELLKESKSSQHFKSLTFKNLKSSSGNATFFTIFPVNDKVIMDVIAAPAMENTYCVILDSVENLSKIAAQLNTLHLLQNNGNKMRGFELLDHIDSIVDKLVDSILKNSEKEISVLMNNVLPKISNFLRFEIARLEAIKLEENEKNAFMDERTASSPTPRI